MAKATTCSINDAECSEGGDIKRGMCSKHYQRWMRANPVRPTEVRPTTCADSGDGECTVGGRIITTKREGVKIGLCEAHYGRERRGRAGQCSATGCCDPVESRDLCRYHYTEWRKEFGPRCSIDGCERVVRADGLCGLHEGRLARYGNALREPDTAPPGAGREFVEFAAQYEGKDCLLWPYSCDPNGYGRVLGEYSGLAHREVLIAAKGLPPDPSYFACHLPGICHDPTCVNPNHLYWGTVQENNDDMYIDGTKVRGEAHWNAVLTKADVRTIRQSGKSGYELSLDYGVTTGCIWSIRNYKTWAWLSDYPADDEAAA